MTKGRRIDGLYRVHVCVLSILQYDACNFDQGLMLSNQMKMEIPSFRPPNATFHNPSNSIAINITKVIEYWFDVVNHAS